MTTRQCPSTAAPTTSTGAHTCTAAATSGSEVKSPGNQVPPPQGIRATRPLDGQASAPPSRLPMTAPAAISTATTTAAWTGVAPASRRAVSRRSRLAAVSLPTEATSTRQGTTSTTRPILVSSHSIPAEPSTGTRDPSRSRTPLPSTTPGGWPTTTTSSSGNRSAWSPIMPTTTPGKRSPSSADGVVRTRSASAGENSTSPGPGSRGIPCATATSPGCSAATSKRSIILPRNSSRVAETASGPGSPPTRQAARSSRALNAVGAASSQRTSRTPTATPRATSAAEIRPRRSLRSNVIASLIPTCRPGVRPPGGRGRRWSGRASRPPPRHRCPARPPAART